MRALFCQFEDLGDLDSFLESHSFSLFSGSIVLQSKLLDPPPLLHIHRWKWIIKLRRRRNNVVLYGFIWRRPRRIPVHCWLTIIRQNFGSWPSKITSNQHEASWRGPASVTCPGVSQAAVRFVPEASAKFDTWMSHNSFISTTQHWSILCVLVSWSRKVRQGTEICAICKKKFHRDKIPPATRSHSSSHH